MRTSWIIKHQSHPANGGLQNRPQSRRHTVDHSCWYSSISMPLSVSGPLQFYQRLTCVNVVSYCLCILWSDRKRERGRLRERERVRRMCAHTRSNHFWFSNWKLISVADDGACVKFRPQRMAKSGYVLVIEFYRVSASHHQCFVFVGSL